MKVNKLFNTKRVIAFVCAFAMVVTTLSGISFASKADGLDDTTQVYVAYNESDGDHLYTASLEEWQYLVGLGWHGDDPAWKAPVNPEGNVQVWRAYNPNSGEHVYGTDAGELSYLTGLGWQNDGNVFLSDEVNKEVPVYRVYNPNHAMADAHYLTSDSEYVEFLVGLGWQKDNNGQPVMYGAKGEEPVSKLTGVELSDYDPYAGDEIAAIPVPLDASDIASYQWTINGQNILGANTATYVIPEEAEEGDEINVIVTNKAGTTFTASESAVVTEEPVPEVYAHITDVEQTGAKEIDITFDVDTTTVTGGFDKNDLSVVSVDQTVVVPITEIEFTDDGTIGTATLSQNLTDGKDYLVIYNPAEGEESMDAFTASVGEVDSIVVTTTTAQQNVKTNIEYVLYDENMIDVTSTVNKNNLSVTVDGSYISTELGDPTKATITMGNVGDKATITVTYNANGTLPTDDVVGAGTVTCVAPEAVVGDPIYNQATTTLTALASGGTKFGPDINATSKCFKFYNYGGAKYTSTYVGQTNPLVYFYAEDEDGNALEYDSYEVESSNDDVLSVTIAPALTLTNGTLPQAGSGKYARIAVTGIQPGTAMVNVKATKNGVETPYTIPVVVAEQSEATNMTILSVDRPVMSNAYDTSYAGQIAVAVTDAAGLPSTDYVSLEIKVGDTTKDYNHGDYVDSAAQAALPTEYATDMLGFTVAPVTYSGNTRTSVGGTYYTAWGAAAGTSYPITATLTKNDGTTISRTVNITVRALPSDVYTTGTDMTYGIELGSNSINVGDTVDAKVYAMTNGLFAGYVENVDATDYGTAGTTAIRIGSGMDATVATAAAIKVKSTSQISNVRLGAKFGTLLANGNDLTDLGQYVPAASTSETFITHDPTKNGSQTAYDYVINDASNTKDLARNGKYTVYFKYYDQTASLDKEQSNTVQVVNDLDIPFLDVTSRTVEGLNNAGVRDVMSTDVDLNNNTSSHESIVNAIQTKDTTAPAAGYVFADATANSGKISVNYAVVTENTAIGEVHFYIPVNATFSLAK